jgi:hypothetical protein
MSGTTGAVSYWTRTIGAHIIEYNSVTKKTLHKKWNSEDDTKVDYRANLLAGLYDNGIAVRTGLLHHGPYTDQYLGCIDFDIEETFRIWCGDDYNLETLAKWTRVEWHKNPTKLHVFFISKTPLANIRQKGIEVYSKRPNLICVYGIHKDGNRIGAYGTKKIAVVDDVKILGIQSRIRLAIPNHIYNYNRDDNTAAHERIEELKKTETTVQTGNVHDAVRSMLVSVYFSYTGELEYMSDEARFQWVVRWDKQKALQANRPAYIDANPDKMEKIWEGIDRKYHDRRQKERDERAAYDNNIHIYRSNNRPMITDVVLKSISNIQSHVFEDAKYDKNWELEL